MTIRPLMGVAFAAAALTFAGAAHADECADVTKTVKGMIDNVSPDKVSHPAMKCAVYAAGLGMLKMFRVVNEECLEDGNKRTQTIAELERTVRKLQSTIDKNCN